jgi:HEAT repeat protein
MSDRAISFLIALFGFSTMGLSAQEPDVAEKPLAAESPAAAPVEEELPWLDSLDTGYRQALTNQQPIFVVIGGPGCPYCRVLEAEMRKPIAQEELKRWTRVKLDLEAAPDQARLMSVGPIPALRLLTPTGLIVVSTEGAQSAEQLVEWLQSNREELLDSAAEELADTGPPTEIEVRKLIRLFRKKDATIREAAIQRMMPYPSDAATRVVESFFDGPLSVQLCSLELLTEWEAPVAGLDPWQPGTLSLEKLKTLSEWAENNEHLAAEARQLSAEELEQAKREIDGLLSSNLVEARAIRERLGRYGTQLLPEVRARIQAATTDQDRERLTALRYRLVAPRSLLLDWPSGLERLASTKHSEKRAAALELSTRASSAEEPLLLELFGDPVPLIREISLRTLKRIGGSDVNSALVRLLDDPDANVRTAVLTQLAVDPSPRIVPRIAEYIKTEQDSDLIVHAARLLREAKGKAAVEALIELLEHENWQVRAEATEGIGKVIDAERSNRGQYQFAYDSLLKRLDDEDGFVISRAMEALKHANQSRVIEPISEVAEKHPELATEVVKWLSQAHEFNETKIKLLRKYCHHQEPQVRAAAIRGICQLAPSECEMELRTLLRDETSQVRTAAAMALYTVLDRQRVRIPVEDAFVESGYFAGPEVYEERPSSSIGNFFRSIFGGRPSPDVEKSDPPTAIETFESEEPLVAPKPDSPDEGLAPPNYAADATGEKLDEYLQQIREGRHHPKWAFDLRPSLETMTESETKTERLTAALTLTALGQDDVSLPVFGAALQTQPHHLSLISPSLKWLPWADRIRLFDEMLPLARSEIDLDSVLKQMALTHDRRAIPALWSALDHERADDVASTAVTSAMTQLMFRTYYFDTGEITPAQRKFAQSELQYRSQVGSYWQRLTALLLLNRIDKNKVAELTREIVENDSEPAPLRRDAFRILLVSQTDREATDTALEVLNRKDFHFREDAVIALTMGRSEITAVAEERLSIASHYDRYGDRNFPPSREPLQAIFPEAPEGLSKEELFPFLQSSDSKTAARAAYLLVLLGERDAFSILHAYWESSAKSDPKWSRLVYRAVAFLDDERFVPDLIWIYENVISIEEHSETTKDFYWTIRIMTGPQILELRKRIRDEVGMNSLR